MDTTNNAGVGRRRRRRHSAEFKAQVVADCRQVGVSIAAVALEYRLNANLVRRWVVESERERGAQLIAARAPKPSVAISANPGFVPVELQAARVATAEAIVVELRRGSTLVKVSWPLSAAAACGAWLGELLR